MKTNTPPKKVTLGELGLFRNGLNFTKEQMGTGLKLINVKDIFGDSPHIDFTNLDLVDFGDSKTISRYTVEENDLFFVRSSVKRNGVGLVRIANQSRRDTIHCGFIIRFRLSDSQTDPLFLTYLLRSPKARQEIINVSGGSAIINISQSTLSSLEINLPSLSTQHKIAAILSAYDDLIENNTRRIKILEEMAQVIYREWFVHFRFPGHETVKMVETELGLVPEGWEWRKLGDALSSIESGSRPKGGIDPSENEVPSIGAENILGLGQYDYSKDKFVSREFFANMTKGIIHQSDVLLYKDGASLGRKSLFRDGFPYEICCINEHVFIIRSNEKCTQSYLYFWLDQPSMTQAIINLNTNAAQPGISQAKMVSLPILIPSQKVLFLWENFVEPILALLFSLANKNNNLRKTRNLLLPKLISGELDLSDLDIPVE